MICKWKCVKGGENMADIEKVIKGLETCIPMKYETNEEKECRHEQCPYGKENYKPMNGCIWDLMKDALELLKKQKPMNVIETSKDRIGVPEKSCPKCNVPLYEYVYGQGHLGEIGYCQWCGQAVKWE